MHDIPLLNQIKLLQNKNFKNKIKKIIKTNNKIKKYKNISTNIFYQELYNSNSLLHLEIPKSRGFFMSSPTNKKY